jgi:hypothetical protein
VKIRISITIEADPKAYAETYGENLTAEAFREDVIQSAINTIVQAAYPEDAKVIKSVKINQGQR